MKLGHFITLEGGEGAGKTELIKRLENVLKNEGHKVLVTREPGGISISEQIRSVILDIYNTSMDGKTEALLYAAARRQHLIEKVIPALEEGYIVLCDRFIDSSIAYQGHARGLGIEAIIEVNKYAIDDYMPGLTLLLDLDPEVGLERISKNSAREINRLDKEALDFHYKVREGYHKAVELFPERIKVINADQHRLGVYLDVLKEVNHYLNNN